MSDTDRLTLRTTIEQPIDIDGLTPERTANLTEDEISA